MIPKDVEPVVGLGLPEISLKTPHKRLQNWSRERWQHDGTRRVARDICQNGKELLAGSNIDWELVLGSIRIEQAGSSLQFGEAAIAIHDSRTIGGLAATAGWSMHDPAIVYLSGKCLANRAGDRLEDFKTAMRQAAVAYGQKVLPQADSYMETLDFLLELKDRNSHRNIINQVAYLLGKGEVKEAYKIVKSRGDLVRTRG